MMGEVEASMGVESGFWAPWEAYSRRGWIGALLGDLLFCLLRKVFSRASFCSVFEEVRRLFSVPIKCHALTSHAYMVLRNYKSKEC